METANTSKKEVQKFIKKGLESILSNVNPKMEKKKFKKSVKKAVKVLYRGAKVKKMKKASVEIMNPAVAS